MLGQDDPVFVNWDQDATAVEEDYFHQDPALVTDRGTLTETPAILAYIAQSFPQARLVPDDPFAFAQAQSFNSYLCATVHINHAHKMRGYRWAVEETSFADMKRKVPETMAASFALIERDMLKGPWVMGEQYTICDPYLFTIAGWLEGDGVDLATLPDEDEAFSERTSILFKETRVVRLVDRARRTLVYLAYSTKVVEGSPFNSLSSVPVMPWQGR